MNITRRTIKVEASGDMSDADIERLSELVDDQIEMGFDAIRTNLAETFDAVPGLRVTFS